MLLLFSYYLTETCSAQTVWLLLPCNYASSYDGANKRNISKYQMSPYLVFVSKGLQISIINLVSLMEICRRHSCSSRQMLG
jgi:hypothetical protein